MILRRGVETWESNDFYWCTHLRVNLGGLFHKNFRQKHLDKEQGMLKALIDNIPDTIYFKDLDSKFTRINKAQARLLGLKHPDEAIGKSDFDFWTCWKHELSRKLSVQRNRLLIRYKVETQGW